MSARWLPLAVVLTLTPAAAAGDWPQWRGPNRDGKATDFAAPRVWPKALAQKWRVAVGDGVATPALVGDRLFVFTRQGGKEVTRGLDAATGTEVWKDEYETGGATGPAGGFAGPRASPAVADGKVVTLGVRGVLSCLAAADGKKLWRKDEKSSLRFFTSSSPVVVDGLCVAQYGGEGSGGLVAYDLATGDEKWRWKGDGAAYASPVLVTVGGTKAVVAETDKSVVAVGAADGKLLWKTPYPVTGRGRGYNASTPMVDGETVVYAGSGRGTRAVKLAKKGEEFAGTEVWASLEPSVQFNTPVLRDGLVFGISAGSELFCVDPKTGKAAWTAPLGGGGGRQSGYGSVVDAGPVLFALTPAAELVAFEPSAKEFKKLASYKVAAGGTYAHPVVSGNRVYVKDADAVTLWTIE